LKLTLLCNAGFCIEAADATLMVDLPNDSSAPFYELPEPIWNQILNREAPYDNVCGFIFTHVHPDHYHNHRVKDYQSRWPEIPIFSPQSTQLKGKGKIGPFMIQYRKFEHAPIPDAPPHVVFLIEVEGKTIYFAGDASLDRSRHMEMIETRRIDAAIWTSMYLSRSDTREMMKTCAEKNLICHMPQKDEPGADTYWKKLEKNLERYGTALENVEVLGEYPTEIII